jgi:ribulose-5-phosphate 4-epimerase/fuculose-1-phosphate aldolase
VSGDDDDERGLRARLATACRILSEQGHDHFHLGHVSARADSVDAAWVKPNGLGLGEVGPEDPALMDLDGRQLRGERPLHNEMPIHTELYRRRPDIRAVVHTHAFYAAALTATHARLEMVSQDSILFADGVGVYDSPELVVSREQGQRLAEALGARRAVLLRNHGLTVVGASVEEATVYAVSLERSCRLQLAATQLGPLAPIGAEEAAAMAASLGSSARRTAAMWDYLVRRLPSGVR